MRSVVESLIQRTNLAVTGEPARELWDAVREQAKAHGVLLCGDEPFIIGQDSADVWAHALHRIDEGAPVAVIVPRDALLLFPRAASVP